MYCHKCGKEYQNEFSIFCDDCNKEMRAFQKSIELDDDDEDDDEYTELDKEEEQDAIRCPYCNSKNIHAHKKGFSGKRAVAGPVLTGGVGILAGTIGSNNIKLTCLNCGKTFDPGDKERMDEAINQAVNMGTPDTVLVCILFGGGVIAIIALLLWLASW